MVRRGAQGACPPRSACTPARTPAQLLRLSPEEKGPVQSALLPARDLGFCPLLPETPLTWAPGVVTDAATLEVDAESCQLLPSRAALWGG